MAEEKKKQNNMDKKREFNIFFSWQADIKESRNLINKALEKAAKELNAQHEDWHVNITSDTRGEDGSPDIEDVVLQKIREAHIFVADITPIAQLEKEGNRKLLPNPNVLIELGYAIRRMDIDKQVILLANEENNAINYNAKDMPFDINHHKISLIKNDISLTGRIETLLVNLIEHPISPNDDIYELDKESVTILFSHFSTYIIDEYLFGNNQNYIDRRIFDMRDAWYHYFNNTGAFTIYDSATLDALNAFYIPFDKLVGKCANNYTTCSNSRLAHIGGLVADEFQDPRQEEKFDEIVKAAIALQPIYKEMIKYIKLKYKLDFDALSKKFEADSSYNN